MATDMTHTSQLTSHILAITNDDIPKSAYDAAKRLLLDVSPTKRLQPAFAARSALWATTLAARGITGPHRVFEGDAGYFKLYMNGEIPDAEELLKPFDAFASAIPVTKSRNSENLTRCASNSAFTGKMKRSTPVCKSPSSS